MGSATEYAQAALDQAGWSLDETMELLVSQTITRVADGCRLREALRHVIAVVPEVQRLYHEREADLRKERNIEELRHRFADILQGKGDGIARPDGKHDRRD